MQRLKAIIVKEIWSLLRDPKARIVLVLPPLIQLFIFTFATTLDVKNVDVGRAQPFGRRPFGRTGPAHRG